MYLLNFFLMSFFITACSRATSESSGDKPSLFDEIKEKFQEVIKKIKGETSKQGNYKEHSDWEDPSILEIIFFKMLLYKKGKEQDLTKYSVSKVAYEKSSNGVYVWFILSAENFNDRYAKALLGTIEELNIPDTIEITDEKPF